MTSKELVAKIKELRQIKPRKDWVVLTKTRILEEEKPGFASSFFSRVIEAIKGDLEFTLRHKLAFAFLTIFIVLIGAFGFAQSSLPGDILYSLKRATEKTQKVFVSEGELIKFDIGIANKRLDELTRVAEKNSVEKLAPAINEYKASVSEVAKGLAKQGDKEAVKEIISEVKKLEEKEERVKSLGAVIGENEELDKACAQKLVENLEALIEDLEGQTLTEEQQEVLDEVKEDIENKNYLEALEKILEEM